MKRKNKITDTNSNVIGKIFMICVFAIALYYIGRNSVFTPYILKKSPTCVKAKIYKNFYPGSRIGRRFAYVFTYNNNDYFGDMDEEGDLKIGDSICVVFWEQYPEINRPLRRFKEDEIKCGCK